MNARRTQKSKSRAAKNGKSPASAQNSPSLEEVSDSASKPSKALSGRDSRKTTSVAPRLPAPPRRRRLPYLLLIVCVLVSCFFLVTYLMNASDVPLKYSRETTLLREPLRADGRIDYFAAVTRLYDSQATPEENGFQKIVSVMGKGVFRSPPPEPYWLVFCQKMNLDPAELPNAAPVSLRDYLAKVFPDDQLPAENDFPPAQKRKMIHNRIVGVPVHTIALTDNMDDGLVAAASPWTLEEYPFMAEWLNANAVLADTLVAALRSEVVFCPKVRASEETLLYETMTTAPYPAVEQMFEVLMARMFQRLGEEDAPGTVSDATLNHMVAALRLVLLLSDSPWPSDRHPVFVEAAFQRCVELIRTRRLNREQLRLLAFELDRISRENHGVDDVVQICQYAALDFAVGLSAGTIKRNDVRLENVPLSPENSGDGVDWNIVARSIGNFYRETLFLLDQHNPVRRDEMSEHVGAMERLQETRSGFYIPTRAKRSVIVGDALALRCAAPVKVLCNDRDKRRTYVDLLRLAVALEWYRLDENRYPENLEKLEPDYMPRVPKDPCLAGEPYRYVLETAPGKPWASEKADTAAEKDDVFEKDTGDSSNIGLADLGYLLYGVSSDRKDHGGASRAERMKADHSCDIRIRMPVDVFRIVLPDAE